MKFMPGQFVATHGALEAMAEAGVLPIDLLSRHLKGDWGDLDADDADRNEDALKDGSRIFSAYLLDKDIKVWIITEAMSDIGIRSATTILLPSEY